MHTHPTSLVPLPATLLFALVATASVEASVDAPRYRAIVHPPLAGFASAYPASFTESGAIVGHASPKPFHPQSVAVMTSNGGLVELPSAAESFNQAMGAGGDGLVVGMMNFQPARWTGGTSETLVALPGYHQGIAWDANASGLIVGIHVNDLFGIDIPVYWASPEAEPVELPYAGFGSSGAAAFAVNDAGEIAGVASETGFFQAARWDSVRSDPVLIGPLEGGVGGEARAINARGDIAGRSTFPDFTTRAMLHLRAEDALVDLGTIAGSYSEARGVNDARQVVGVSSAGQSAHGFLWSDGAIHDLSDIVVATNEPFLHVSLAVDIDEAGRIAAEVVVGDVPDGPRRIALLVPCAIADLDCDGAVNGADLAQLLGAWGGPGDADLDGDGTVTAADLAILLGEWSR